MNLKNIRTPAFLLDIDKLDKNMIYYQSVCEKYNKKLVPMIKTHKSTDITRKQIDFGADSFLVGTISEAIKLVELGVKEITLAYPFLGEANLNVINNLLAQTQTHIILSIDTIEAARQYHTYLKPRNKTIDYLLLINGGLNRFGVEPNKAGEMVNSINHKYSHMIFKGISTHPGQVYRETDYTGIKKVAEFSGDALYKAILSLKQYHFEPDIVATGSTPTFMEDIKYDFINVLRPGNYVYNDCIQIALGVAKEEDCSLTILTTVLSNPQKGVYIVDCGSKCLGLDKGAHGNKNVVGFGKIKGHEELIVDSLSEEVAVVKCVSQTNIKIGDKLEIIPNHSCSAANMTSYLIGIRNKEIEKIYEVDMRGNSIKPI